MFFIKNKLKIIIFLMIIFIITIFAIIFIPGMLKKPIFIEYPKYRNFDQGDILYTYRETFPDSDIQNDFVSQKIRGQLLINEIDRYYNIYNKYPKYNSLDNKDIVNIYRRAFPDEDIQWDKLPQPYYEEKNFSLDNYYQLYFFIGWDKKYLWDWLFIYDSRTEKWTIGFSQY